MKNDIIDETPNEIVDETKESSHYSSAQAHSQPRMRYCTRCGSLLKDSAKFCENCGKYRYASENILLPLNPAFPSKTQLKKDGKSYGVPALIMIITSYSLYFMPEIYNVISFSMLYLISIILYFCSSVLAIVTLANSRKGKVPAIITLCLAAIPILFIIFGFIVTIAFFATHPDWEP